MGHTTRCVPVIRYLLGCGYKVLFAGNDQQCNYITATIAGINTIKLEGYNVHYASSAFMFMPSIAGQLPKLLAAIKKEHEWLKNIVKQHEIDAVISDNRYGLYHDEVPCVIMTHQLQVLSGMGTAVDSILRKLHYKYLEKFNECWVVDISGGNGLAGKLSHPEIFPQQTSYIGLLSQIEEQVSSYKGYILVLLSGPEPQRTILADKIWEQLQHYEGKVVFAEGSTNVPGRTDIPDHITYHRQLVKDNLEEVLSGADIVICRSGYSTLMDLVRLNKKAILIPTPGQTEQEYLAQHLQDIGAYIYVQQASLNLSVALKAAKDFRYVQVGLQNSFDIFRNVVDRWLDKRKED